MGHEIMRLPVARHEAREKTRGRAKNEEICRNLDMNTVAAQDDDVGLLRVE